MLSDSIQTNFKRVNSENLIYDYKSQEFDVVIDIENCFFYSDKARFFRGVYQVLRDDGVFFLGDAKQSG